VRPMESRVRGASDEAVGIEERADAPERDAHGDRRGDADPVRHRLPGSAAAAHQGGFSPTGHLAQPDSRRDPAGGIMGGWRSRRRSFGSRRERDARLLDDELMGFVDGAGVGPALLRSG
jgi:hypothetical protein